VQGGKIIGKKPNILIVNKIQAGGISREVRKGQIIGRSREISMRKQNRRRILVQPNCRAPACAADIIERNFRIRADIVRAEISGHACRRYAKTAAECPSRHGRLHRVIAACAQGDRQASWVRDRRSQRVAAKNYQASGQWQKSAHFYCPGQFIKEGEFHYGTGDDSR